jgi:hypothetical protein
MLSHSYADGSLRKGVKSVLLAEFENMIETFLILPRTVQRTARLVDGMALLYSLNISHLQTFGQLAESLFGVITSYLGDNGCDRIDIVFDRYDWPQSIKEGERRRRGQPSLEITIN